MLGIVFAVIAVARATAAESSHELQHRADAANERAAAARRREHDLGAEIDAQSRAIDGVESRVGRLGGELVALEARLTRSRAEVRRLEQATARKARELAFARRKFTVAQERLGERLVDIYTAGQPELAEILVGAASLDDLVAELETRERIVEQDRDLADQISASKARLARERVRLVTLRTRRAAQTARLAGFVAERRAAYTAVVAERNRLVTLRAARRRTLAGVSVDRRQWEAQADALSAGSAQVAAAATAPVSEAAPAPSSPPSSGFIWPVRGSVVSPYGRRWGRLHAGIDIACGYGLIVVIQHADNIATAYAHNSRINVAAGQSVAQGQTIAAVGCTGSCFGDHVQFEVRVGGSPVDPLRYL